MSELKCCQPQVISETFPAILYCVWFYCFFGCITSQMTVSLSDSLPLVDQQDNRTLTWLGGCLNELRNVP